MPGNSFVSLSSTASFPVYSSGAQTPVGGLPEGLAYPSATSPVSPPFQTRPTLGGMSMMPDMNNINAMFDPSHPALFNFNLENLDFGSNYPALEFGILGHMAGASDAPSTDTSASGPPSADVNLAGMFGGNGQFGPGAFEGAGLSDFPGMDSSNGYLQGNLQHGLPHAYAIAANMGGTGLASPSTENTASPQPNPFEGSPTTATYSTPQGSQAPTQAPTQARPKPKTSSKGGLQSVLGKRRRDASYIYETVKEPYPYLAAFHNLIAFLQKRYSSSKISKIAKSLASIRPSFLACTTTLTKQDLIFMEICFQRTLFEYEEDIMAHVCAPTIVCRRTGEVAAVNKEFCALTGWSKDVLLGKEPNLNINTGGSASPTVQRPGLTTPRLKTATLDSIKATNEGRPQPVFIPELLDDDSVVQFYEDFAELAFENSRGRVTRKGRLLKYRTLVEALPTPAPPVLHQKDPRSGKLSSRVARIDSVHGISSIEKDGKVDCTYCWEIKRDTFNIPMLIIINVSLLLSYPTGADPVTHCGLVLTLLRPRRRTSASSVVIRVRREICEDIKKKRIGHLEAFMKFNVRQYWTKG